MVQSQRSLKLFCLRIHDQGAAVSVGQYPLCFAILAPALGKAAESRKKLTLSRRNYFLKFLNAVLRIPGTQSSEGPW